MKKKFTLLLLLAVFASLSSFAQNVSGVVFTGETNNQNQGVGTNLDGSLYVNIVNSNGVLIASQMVNADGTYSFSGLPTNMGNNWRIVLTNSATNKQGNRLPGLWFARNVVGTISNPVSQDEALDGEIFFRLGGSNPTNIVNQSFWVREQNPFTCENGIAYQVAAPAINNNATLYSYNILTGIRTTISQLPLRVNGLSYSTATQNILWGHEMGSSRLVRIGPGGGTITYRIPNLPGGTNYIAASEIQPGYILLYSGSDTRYYVVDVDPSRPSYLELVDPTNGFAVQASEPYGLPVSAWAIQDFVYIPNTGKLWTVTLNGRLTSMDPLTGVVTTETQRIAGLPSGDAIGYGAVFADNTGKLYIFRNETGRFIQVDPVNNSAVLLTRSDASANNDGASCITATICDINVTNDVPSELNVCTGVAQVFSIEAESTEDETLSYQWQVSTDGGNTWSDVIDGTTPGGTYSGANTSDLSIEPTTTAWNNNQYRVIVSSASGLCVIESSPSTLTVQDIPTIAPTHNGEDICIIVSTSETANLNNHITSTAPAGTTLQFFTAGDILVTDPTQVGVGTYYAVYVTSSLCPGPQSAPIIVDDCSLPVVLSDINVRQEGTGAVAINWSTASETYSSHFDVERSSDTKNWKLVNRKDAAGKSNSNQQYLVVDEDALEGINYYRLKMVDRDGTFEYSQMKSITVAKDKLLFLYPNPTKGMLQFSKTVNVKELSIYTLSGVKVFQRVVNGTEQVEIGELQSGTYVVELQLTEGKKLSRRLLIDK